MPHASEGRQAEERMVVVLDLCLHSYVYMFTCKLLLLCCNVWEWGNLPDDSSEYHNAVWLCFAVRDLGVFFPLVLMQCDGRATELSQGRHSHSIHTCLVHTKNVGLQVHKTLYTRTSDEHEPWVFYDVFSEAQRELHMLDEARAMWGDDTTVHVSQVQADCCSSCCEGRFWRPLKPQPPPPPPPPVGS